MAISFPLVAKGFIGTTAVATTALGTVLWKSSSVSQQEGDLGDKRNADIAKDDQRVNGDENIVNRPDNEEVTKKTKKQALEEVDNLLLAEIDKFKSWSENGDEIKIQRSEENKYIGLKVRIIEHKGSNNFTHQISFESEEEEYLVDNYEGWICNIQMENKIEVSDLKKDLLGISESNTLNTDNMKKTVRICAERREDDSDSHESSQIDRNIKISSTLIYEGEDADDQWFNDFFKNKTSEQQ